MKSIAFLKSKVPLFIFDSLPSYLPLLICFLLVLPVYLLISFSSSAGYPLCKSLCVCVHLYDFIYPSLNCFFHSIHLDSLSFILLISLFVSLYQSFSPHPHTPLLYLSVFSKLRYFIQKAAAGPVKMLLPLPPIYICNLHIRYLHRHNKTYTLTACSGSLTFSMTFSLLVFLFPSFFFRLSSSLFLLLLLLLSKYLSVCVLLHHYLIYMTLSIPSLAHFCQSISVGSFLALSVSLL